MAIIGKIRNYSGLLIAIIGIALAAFVLGDFWSGSNTRGSIKDFGEINGELVKYQEFEKLVNDNVQNYIQKNNIANIAPNELHQIRQAVWEDIVKEKIMLEEYVALGLAISYEKTSKPSISPEELSDLVLGANPHPYIYQNFINPNTGTFDRERVQSIVDNFENMSPEDQIAWVALEKAIKDEKLNSKYRTLISQGYYTPTALAKREYTERNTVAEVRFVALPYKEVSDSAIVVTDEDYKNYYNEHKYEFEQEKSRDLIYVVFDIKPSLTDRALIDSTVSKIYNEFKEIDDKELVTFVRKNSEESYYDSSFYSKGSFSPKVDSLLFSSDIGKVVEPYVDNNMYFIHRVVAKETRPDSLKPAHIFITYKGAERSEDNVTRTKEDAQKLADSLLAVVKRDTSAFSAMAREFSDDLSAKENGGHLGWMKDGSLLKELNDACINSNIGDIVIVNTQFGYHILKIFDKTKAVEKIQVATILRSISASEKTVDNIYAQAADFATEAVDAGEFERAVIDKKLNKRTAQFVREMDNTLPGVESAREVVQWAFGDKTEKNDASGQIFNCESKYVVAAVVEVREKGIASLEQVKSYIEPLVKREKKAEILTEKLNNNMNGISDINQLAVKLNTKVDTIDYLTFSSNNIPDYGSEPIFVGNVFTQSKNTLSKPIKGDQAIYAAYIYNIKEAEAEEDMAPWKAQVTGFFKSRLMNPQNDDVYNALFRKAEITDNRRYYY
jgi:peptidyl-prolyl cis-trans isomerase D